MSVTAQAPAQSLAKNTFLSTAKFLIQVSRPGLWTTTILFYLMPLGRSLQIHNAAFWFGVFYIVFPLSLLLYGVNDIVDAEGDRFNPRKGTYLFGSRGADPQLKSLRWQIAVSQIPFLFLFWFYSGSRILLWFLALLFAVYVYNARPVALKGRPPFDVLIQASYLLIFILSSWLNRVPQLPWQTFSSAPSSPCTLTSSAKSWTSSLTKNPAAARSPRNSVASLQNSSSPRSSLSNHFSSAITSPNLVIAAFLALGALFFIADAILLWKNRPYSPPQMRLFLWGWNIAAVLGILWNAAHGSLLAVRSAI